MNSSSPRPAVDRPLEERLARLLDMGFERPEPAAATTESVPIGPATHRLTRIRPAMGSFVSITAVHGSHTLAEHSIGVAFEEMDRLTGLLNRFDSTSALSYLNDTGSIAGAPPELSRVVESSLAVGRTTGGAFDITVKPVIDLFRDPVSYEPLGSRPDDQQITAALGLVGLEHVQVAGGGLRLKRQGMGLTLDGIAKGYIVDGIAASLEGHGVSSYLINAGGDIRTAGNRGDGTPWTIAVRDPADGAPSWDSAGWDSKMAPSTISLAGGAIATSGSYEVYFDHERLAHHIVRSDIGRSPRRAVSVTVTAPTTLQADALATAALVLGPQRGASLIERIRHCECLVIDRHGEHTRSSGWAGTPAPNNEQTQGARGSEQESP